MLRGSWTISCAPSAKSFLEFLTADYRELPPPAGTFVLPGHAIESMWFVMHVARRRGDRDLIRRAAEVVRWHLELGWDAEYGGIYLSRDIEGHEPYLPHSDKKILGPGQTMRRQDQPGSTF